MKSASQLLQNTKWKPLKHVNMLDFIKLSKELTHLLESITKKQLEEWLKFDKQRLINEK